MSKIWAYKFHIREKKHRNMSGAIFGLLAISQEKLWFIEHVELDVQIRPVFADSVTFVFTLSITLPENNQVYSNAGPPSDEQLNFN